MSVYSIKDLEQLSGIKAHTLRIWEQRYNFIKPKRTETNIRYYTDEDLKLILNIALLKENGHKISKISKMPHNEVYREVQRITERKLNSPEQIQALILTMLDMDEEKFEKILSGNILQHGFEKTMLELIIPFFSKIGILWQTGTINPAHEHFISNLVRQKLIVAIDGLLVSTHELKDKYMLFLPEEELHEISLLFSSYIIKSRKNKVIYLGQNLPIEDLQQAYEFHKPKYLLSVFTSYPKFTDAQLYIDQLSSQFPESTILLSGYQLIGNDLHYPDNVVLFNKVEDLMKFVGNN